MIGSEMLQFSLILSFMIYVIEGRYPLVSLNDSNKIVDHPAGSGRIVNVKTSTEYYPWMAYIERNTILESTGDTQEMICTGSIISNKMVILTNAHCVCTYNDVQVTNARVNTECKANVGQKLTNQQTKQTDPKLNYLIAKVGSQDINKGRQVEIDKAFVMKTQVSPSNQVELYANYDVGLLFPNSKYIPWMKEPSLKPIKLASKNQGYLINNKEVKIAGWGSVYEETIKKGVKTSTSCMTTNQGPESYHFQPCNPSKPICKKTYPPNSLNQEKCKKLWKRARLNIPNKGKHEFDENADIIGIKIGKTSQYCYKEDNWKTHGWCDVNKNKGWGICSYSCKFFGDELSPFPAKYRETKKKIHANKGCSVGLVNDAEVCLDAIYPKTWIWQFTEDKGEDTITGLTFDKKIEIVNHNAKRLFISACHGDSGGPIWIVEKTQPTLVAIHKRKDKVHACGSAVGDKEIAINVILPDINDWITKHAEI